MKKLRLQLDAVQVETFATQDPGAPPRGTVDGRQDHVGPPPPAGSTLQASCFGECPFTQRYTCEGYGCTRWGDLCVA